MRQVRDNEKEVKSKPEFTKRSRSGRKSRDSDSTDILPLQCDPNAKDAHGSGASSNGHPTNVTVSTPAGNVV